MNSKPVSFHPEALAEAVASTSWYRERSQRAAEAFVKELEDAIRLISESPRRWPLFEHRTRRYPLLRFPYLIVYRETRTSIEIVAVAHGRRKPGYWQFRK